MFKRYERWHGMNSKLFYQLGKIIDVYLEKNGLLCVSFCNNLKERRDPLTRATPSGGKVDDYHFAGL